MAEPLDLIRRYDPQAIPMLDRAEMVWVAAVDPRDRVRDFRRVAMGGCSRVEVHLPPLLAVPLMAGVDRFVLYHNHPGSWYAASQHDIDLTRRVVAGAQAAGLHLIDHEIVMPDGRSLSMVAAGLLEPPQTILPIAAENRP